MANDAYTFPTLTVSAVDEAGIIIIGINRPNAKNALDTATIADLGRAVERADNDSAVKAIIITGEGKVFGIGADIPEIQAAESGDGMRAMLENGHAVYDRIERCTKPVCAAINGVFCLGGSLELALACHFRVASKKTQMGLPEVKLGLIPGYGGTQRLPRLIGKGRALALILTGDTIRSTEALAIGLIHAEADDVIAESKALLGRTLKNGPLAVAAAIRAVVEGVCGDFSTGSTLERQLFTAVRDSADAAEGLSAHGESRPPQFRGA